MKLKKAPYYLLLLFLAICANLIFGFLSFAGMFIISPVLGLVIAAFVLSYIYDFEIYLQKIKNAFDKLFKRNFLKNQLATNSLLQQFENNVLDSENCPQFFKDYEAQLVLLYQFKHNQLNRKAKNKRKIEKTLKDMEKWYAAQLFSDEREIQELTDYEKELRIWLGTSIQEANTLYANRSKTYKWVLALSGISGFFMSIGISYLLVDAFSIIPLLAAIPFALLPALIIPMALISGLVYTLLIYNAVIDMIHSDILRKSYYKLRKDFEQGLTPRNIFMAISAIVLLGLTVALTLCTAGAWWTIAKYSKPLFGWMTKIPGLLRAMISSIILGASQLIFNVQNSAETFEIIDEAATGLEKVHREEGLVNKLGQGIAKLYHHVMDNENWLQIVNPFRLLLKLTVTPLRLLFFLGHIIRSATSRIPDILKITLDILAIISEGFKDSHYHSDNLLPDQQHPHNDTKELLQKRFGKNSDQNSSLDIPSRLLTFIFSPLYALAAGWDYAATRLVNQTNELSWVDAWDKQMGRSSQKSLQILPIASSPSREWQRVQSIHRIDHYLEKHLNRAKINEQLAAKKAEGLRELRQDLRAMHDVDEGAIRVRILQESTKAIYSQQRFFKTGDKTCTEKFLAELPERISSDLARR